ncbi:unnamed protein product, partial [Didymodactylos carnosus]
MHARARQKDFNDNYGHNTYTNGQKEKRHQNQNLLPPNQTSDNTSLSVDEESTATEPLTIFSSRNIDKLSLTPQKRDGELLTSFSEQQQDNNYIQNSKHLNNQTLMASYSFPSPGYANVPSFYSQTQNPYLGSGFNLQYPFDTFPNTAAVSPNSPLSVTSNYTSQSGIENNYYSYQPAASLNYPCYPSSSPYVSPYNIVSAISPASSLAGPTTSATVQTYQLNSITPTIDTNHFSNLSSTSPSPSSKTETTTRCKLK